MAWSAQGTPRRIRHSRLTTGLSTVKQDLTSFSRTLRALDGDGLSPALLGVVLVAGLAGVWSAWLIAARVPVYQLSEVARLEVERIHPVAAPVGGRVVSTALVLGRDVRQGDVLLEVESERERLETDEGRTRLSAVGGEIAGVDREIGAIQGALDETRRAARAALTEAEQRANSAEAASRAAQDKIARVSQLEKLGLVAAAEAESVKSEAQARRADLQAARAGVERLRAEQIAAEREHRGRLASLERERTGLEGERAAMTSSVARRESEAERRRIRAPVSGKIGEVAAVQVGAVIRDGDRLASIIPSGDVRAVADFAAPSLGRVKPGQPARLRLDGFPWTQYGYIDATVTSVATESRDQRVRVELALRPPMASRIPLQHGMPGAVEIEVERVAPLALLARSLGQTLSGTATAPPQAQGGAR
jgi:multidrug resistance efflux pump